MYSQTYSKMTPTTDAYGLLKFLRVLGNSLCHKITKTAKQKSLSPFSTKTAIGDSQSTVIFNRKMSNFGLVL